jgi:hypothetical protein
MPKIQIDLSDEEDQIVEVYKTANRLETKEQAIKNMIKGFRRISKAVREIKEASK